MRVFAGFIALVFAVALADGACVHSAEPEVVAGTRLGVEGDRFTLNGEPTFLLGASYYAGLGATDEQIRLDLDDLQRLGFNWIRVWATWASFENDVSAIGPDGSAVEAQLNKLKSLVSECDRRGMVVDVTLSRGNGISGPPRLKTIESHKKAVETLVGALASHGNWYLDLANERNIEDERFVPFDELRDLRETVRRLDEGRLVTASHAGDMSRADVREYLLTVGVDFVSPHRPREPASPGETEAKSREYLGWMKELGRTVPLHYQEPFRRGFGEWEPIADDFVRDAKGAKRGGAAGWCFHNGDGRAAEDGRPRRSFDFREGRLFEQLDEEEREAIARVGRGD